MTSQQDMCLRGLPREGAITCVARLTPLAPKLGGRWEIVFVLTRDTAHIQDDAPFSCLLESYNIYSKNASSKRSMEPFIGVQRHFKVRARHGGRV